VISPYDLFIGFFDSYEQRLHDQALWGAREEIDGSRESHCEVCRYPSHLASIICLIGLAISVSQVQPLEHHEEKIPFHSLFSA